MTGTSKSFSIMTLAIHIQSHVVAHATGFVNESLGLRSSPLVALGLALGYTGRSRLSLFLDSCLLVLSYRIIQKFSQPQDF